MADKFGRKTLYVLGFALFGAAALAAGFCTTALQLIIVRAVQGAAGAFMLADSAAIVADTFPRQQLGLALEQLAMTLIERAAAIPRTREAGGTIVAEHRIACTEAGGMIAIWFRAPGCTITKPTFVGCDRGEEGSLDQSECNLL